MASAHKELPVKGSPPALAQVDCNLIHHYQNSLVNYQARLGELHLIRLARFWLVQFFLKVFPSQNDPGIRQEYLVPQML